MINDLKQLKNLSIPQRLIRAMIIILFQAKIKLGQDTRTAKTQATVMAGLFHYLVNWMNFLTVILKNMHLLKKINQDVYIFGNYQSFSYVK